MKEVIERDFCGFAFMSSTLLHLYTHQKLSPSLLSWVHSCLMYILVHLGRLGELMPRERPKRKAFCKWKFVTIRGVLRRRGGCGEKGSPLFEEGEVNSDGGGSFQKGYWQISSTAVPTSQPSSAPILNIPMPLHKLKKSPPPPAVPTRMSWWTDGQGTLKLLSYWIQVLLQNRLILLEAHNSFGVYKPIKDESLFLLDPWYSVHFSIIARF